MSLSSFCIVFTQLGLDQVELIGQGDKHLT